MRLRTDRKKQRGIALVEAAVTLPVFLLVLLSIVEVGRLFQVQQSVTNAASMGARFAMVPVSGNNLQPASAVQDKVNSLLLETANISGATVEVIPALGAVAPRVRVTVLYSPIIGMSWFDGFSFNLKAEAMMAQ